MEKAFRYSNFFVFLFLFVCVWGGGGGSFLVLKTGEITKWRD